MRIVFAIDAAIDWIELPHPVNIHCRVAEVGNASEGAVATCGPQIVRQGGGELLAKEFAKTSL